MVSRKKKDVSEIEERNLTLACEMAQVCDDKRGEDVLVLDVRGISSFADFFVIATAANQPQMRGMVKDMERVMKKHRVRQYDRNGLEDGKWVLLDFGDTLVHLFDPQSREFYELEQLWGDAPQVSWRPVASKTKQ